VKGLRIPFLLLCTLLGSLLAALAGPPATAAPSQAQLEIIRAAHHPGYDRVVFEFRGPLPTYRLRYVDTLTGDPSGLPVPVPGRAILEVTMHNAVAHDDFGPRASRRNTFPLPNVMSVLQSGDFEGVVTYGVGLASRQPYRAFTLTNPSRLVVDIDAGFTTVQKPVYFIDEHRYAANTPPFVRSVLRPVLAAAPATAVMDRLFAGPTPAEAESGLRPPTYPSLTARSKATGFANLSIAEGIARVRLTGGCSSGGSTITVANEIMPTLRQFSTVDYVKIYDPAGRTQRPTGRSDSIPTCLEP
jgi:hypothetical protein